VQGKNGANIRYICEYFNTAEAEICIIKSHLVLVASAINLSLKTV